ncbi:OsmC family protein [bacterium]|nr:OsmC family protein [bacterium]
MAVVTFKATSKWIEGLQVDNTVRDFVVRMDEPTNLGGTDTGMNPVEGLLVSLGSCLTIVAAAFAKAHKIDLQDFWVELEGDLDPDGFLKGKPGVRNGFQQVRVTPHIKTSSSEEDVIKFMEFVKSRCPVSDVMINGTEIVPADPILE